MRLKELAAARVRYGYRRLHILLRREGCEVNHKRTYQDGDCRSGPSCLGANELGATGKGGRRSAVQMRSGPWTSCLIACSTDVRSGS